MTALGSVGFACGFFGPIFLNPGANQGPLFGIFFTGPTGVLLGLVFGLASAALRLRLKIFAATLGGITFVYAMSILYMSLPEARLKGFVIDAEVRSCESPELSVADATSRVSRWEARRSKKSRWRPDWREDINRMLDADSGVVLKLFVHRRMDIYEQRKPWNKGQLKPTAWIEQDSIQMFFSRRIGPSCNNYPPGYRAYFSPQWEPAGVSPPDILPTFLGMHVLEAVLPEFQPFIDGYGTMTDEKLGGRIKTEIPENK